MGDAAGNASCEEQRGRCPSQQSEKEANAGNSALLGSEPCYLAPEQIELPRVVAFHQLEQILLLAPLSFHLAHRAAELIPRQSARAKAGKIAKHPLHASVLERGHLPQALLLLGAIGGEVEKLVLTGFKGRQ